MEGSDHVRVDQVRRTLGLFLGPVYGLSYNNSPSGYFFTILTFSVVTRKATSQSVSNHGRKYLAHGSTCILDNNGKTLQNVPGSYQYLSENGVIAIIFT